MYTGIMEITTTQDENVMVVFKENADSMNNMLSFVDQLWLDYFTGFYSKTKAISQLKGLIDAM